MSDLAGLPRELTESDLQRRLTYVSALGARAAVALGVWASLAFLPLVIAQGIAVRRRLPTLPPAAPPHGGLFSGRQPAIRLLAIGESTVAGVGLSRGDETVAATTARCLSLLTRREV